MGTSGWDEESWDRGRSPRDGRGGRPDNRAYDRSSRGGSPPPRTADRPRGPRRDDDWGGPAGGRSARRSPDGPPGEWDSGRRPNGRGRPPADDMRERGRPPRDDRRDPYDERGGRDGRGLERPGDRSMRGQRPPRDDDWDGAARGRGGPPVAAAGRTRAPGRGGLWDDEEPVRRRPDGSDPRGRTMAGGRIDPRDPRSLRRGLVETSASAAVEKKKGGLSFGKAILVILLMFVVGAGAAFGYWKFTTPPLPSDASAPSSTPATSGTPGTSGTPATTPSATPHALTSPSHSVAVVTIAVSRA